MQTKKCSICGKEKELTEFYKSSGAKCKKCFNAKQYRKRIGHMAYKAEWQRENRDHVNAYAREYRKRTKPPRKLLSAEEKAERNRLSRQKYFERKRQERIAEREAKALEEKRAEEADGRVCRKCGERKPLDCFRRPRGQCKTCENKAHIAYSKRREKDDPEFKALQKHYDKLALLKRKGVAGEHTRQEWAELKAKHDYTCLRCGKREPEITLTKDHIKPVSKGGTNDIGNIQPLCHSCNSRKFTQEITYGK